MATLLESAQSPLARRLDRVFELSARGTTVRTEIIAGATTFVTMAYVLFVNPGILGSVPDANGKLSTAAVLTSTALVSALTTLAMGLFANLPLALAPGMGLNSVVTFQLVASMHLSWPQAMGVIVAEGLAITALVLTGLRQAVVRSVPITLKKAIGIGIGLFLAFIGLVNAGFVSRNVSGPVPVRLGAEGYLSGFPMVLFASTVLLTAFLVARGYRAGLLIGMAVSTLVALLAHALGVQGGVAPPPAILSVPDLGQLGRFDFGFFGVLGLAPAALVIFSLMLSDFFDTVGTVVAVGQEAHYLDEKGDFPRPGTVLLIDSLAAVAGGAAGCSSATTYVESASGAAAGGRTGLTSVVTALLFAGCIVLAPLAGVVPPQATGAVLVLVGFFMMRDVGSIAWDDSTEAIPAFLTLVVMPFTYSITNGIGAGFISYAVIKLATGRGREVHPLMWASSAAFLAYFVFSKF